MSSPLIVWDMIAEQNRANLAKAPSRETTFVFVGTESAGKTSLMSSFIYKAKPDDLRATAGLDYKYTRTSTTGDAKIVSHFWEIGGGQAMAAALPVVLSDNAVVLIILDLSRPNTILPDLLFWTSSIAAANKPGATRCIVIVANKYDLIPKESDLICKTLRAIALDHGAFVVSHSIDNKNLQAQMRTILSRFIIDKAQTKTAQVEHTKPLLISPGADSAESIGAPAGERSGKSAAWCTALRRIFPDAAPDILVKDAMDLKLEPEAVVDAMWVQKRDELKQIQAAKAKQKTDN